MALQASQLAYLGDLDDMGELVREVDMLNSSSCSGHGKHLELLASDASGIVMRGEEVLSIDVCKGLDALLNCRQVEAGAWQGP